MVKVQVSLIIDSIKPNKTFTCADTDLVTFHKEQANLLVVNSPCANISS